MPKIQEQEKERRFPVLLRTAWFALNKAFRERLRDTDLTPVQFTTLRWLAEREQGSLSQKDLAELTATNSNNVADLVDRLEAKGWTRREKDVDDARRNVLWLMDAGRETYERARSNALILQREVMATVLPEKCEHFLSTLARINENLDSEKQLP